MQNNTFSADSIGQNVIVLEQIGSTNDYLKFQLSNFTPFAEWTAIMARHQTQGRGERGNKWLVPAGLNLTFSTVAYPTYIRLQDHFSLNILISLALMDWLDSLSISASIKWPNDIMLNGRKIAGLLIENKSSGSTIRQSVIGIGINVNQLDFPSEIAHTASSILRETGMQIPDLLQACKNILCFLQQRFETFKNQQVCQEELLKEYNQRLFRKDILADYSNEEGNFQGKLLQVDSKGLLHLEIAGQEKVFQFKEVRFLLQ